MADLKNSRNTQLNTSTVRLVSNQKAVTVTSPDLLVNYDSTGTLVPGQVMQVTALKFNTVAPVVWSTSNSAVKLYTAETGTTEITSDPSVSGTSTVYLRASEFNAQSLSSLKVIATITDIDVATADVTFIKLQASPGSSTFTASLYLQNASYPVETPPAAPVGGTFNFATGVLTAPTGTPQWTVTQPQTSTTPTWACEYNFTGTSTQTVTAATWQNVRIDTVTGAAGTRTAILDLYRWSSTVPTTFPSGTSVYTWSTAQFVAKTTPTFVYNSWTTVPGTPVLGQTLYIARQVYADTGSSLTSDVAWSTTTPLPLAVSGVNGTRTGVLEVYKWSPTQPTSSFPTGTSTYTWATGIFDLPATANGWSLLPGASVAGSTLWAVQTTIANTSTSSTNTVTWPTTGQVAYAIGAAGIGGTSKNRVELYWQTATAPAVPTNTRYTFSTNTVEVIPGSGGSLGSWLRTPPQSTTTATWMTSCQFSVVSPADQHDSSAWSTPVVYAQTGSNGFNGTKIWLVSAFLWSNAANPPAIPVLSTSFNWSDKSIGAYPSGWSGSAPGAPGSGYTLYQITVTVTADVEATTTEFNWSSASRGSVGYRVDGTIGPTGDSARVAYTVTTSATVPGAVTSGSGDVVPTGPGTWSFSATSTLTAGQYMYQVDGILSRTTGNITWGNPYLSNLKVGTLSAITANVGNLTVASGGNIQTFNKGYGVAGGFFIGFDETTNKFSIGDKLLYNGSTFSLPGITIGSSGGIDGIGTGNGTIVNNDAVRAGGVNLVGNSGFLRNNSTLPTNWSVYNNASIAVTSTVQTGGMFGQNYVRVTAGANTSSTLGIYVVQSSSDSVKAWEPGQTYCISFWVRGSAGAVGKTMSGLNSNMGWTSSTQLENPAITASWQRYVWRVIPANNANTASGELYISHNETSILSGSVFDISCPKVELGTQPSSWTPSPQDTMNINLEPSITTAQTTATNAASAAATAQTTATNAASAAATANASIADISSDSLLTPDEKPQIIQDYDVIIAEKTGINAQATTYGVTTENTAYNTAVTALTTYLATLTSPVLWSTLTGNTTIVGATFRTNFKYVYTARQALLDKISTTAKTLSDQGAAAAVSTASADATAKANTAQSNAISTAAADATTKANAAQAAAIAAAATDATAKAATKLNKSAADTLTGPITVSTTGGIVSGDLTWDSTGTRTGGKGVAITPKGIVGHDGTKTTFVIEATTGNATFSGALSAASGNFTGAVYGGSYTNYYAWPAAGGTGFYLGPEGLLLGTANGTNPQYFQITAAGNVNAPGFSIAGGSATFSGTLSGAIVNTDQIVGNAASVAYTASSTGNTVSVTVTVPPNASAVLLDYYLGPPTQTAFQTTVGSGKEASFASGYVNGPILDSLKDNNAACSSIIISPSTGTHTYTVTRTYYTGTMRLSVLILKR